LILCSLRKSGIAQRWESSRGSLHRDRCHNPLLDVRLRRPEICGKYTNRFEC
jgi:hypothetical protein